MAKKKQNKSKSKKGSRSRGLYGNGGVVKKGSGNRGRGMFAKGKRKKDNKV
jgi:hypothetical protein